MKDKKNINNIEYVLVGDYYIPNLKPPHEERPIGKYGRMHREYLKEHNPMMFNDLVLDGQIWTYLADLNEQAQERLSLIVKQMKVTESVTEELKAADQMAWIRAMNVSTIGQRKLCGKKSYIDNILPDFIFEGVRLPISRSSISVSAKT